MCDEEGLIKCDLMTVMIMIILLNNIDDAFDVDKKMMLHNVLLDSWCKLTNDDKSVANDDIEVEMVVFTKILLNVIMLMIIMLKIMQWWVWCWRWWGMKVINMKH